MQFSSKIAKEYYNAPESYNVIQFHFHSPSEHAVDGKLFDLELHTVHLTEFRTPGNSFLAAAVGLLFSVNDYTAELTESEQKIIDEFFESLEWRKFNPKKPDGKWEVNNVKYADLLNMVDTNNRWIYKGSVTTPPCAEDVYWNVLRTVYPISQKYVDQFKSQLAAADRKVYRGKNTLDNVGNRRETQPIGPNHSVMVYQYPATEDDYNTESQDTNSLTINAGREEMSVDFSEDYYSGSVSAMNDDYQWNYRRSGAVSLLGSALTFANVALNLA